MKGENMKVIGYATKSKFGFQKMNDAETMREHMKWLHSQEVKFIPMVLVDEVPGEEKPKWFSFNDFYRFKKGLAYAS